MTTSNTPKPECRCGKEFRPISQGCLVYRCLFSAGFLAVTVTDLLTQIQRHGGC